MSITMKIQVVAFEEGRQRRIDIMKCFLTNTGKAVMRFLTFVGVFVSVFFTLKMITYMTEAPIPDLDMTGDVLIHESKKLEKDQPGFFMKGMYPLNNTFCRFNYGLPKTLDWQLVPISGTPQLGKKSPYRVIYNAIERSMFDSSYTMDKVTYATHVTPEFLYHIVEIARFWDGPISVTAFVPNYDLDITMKLFTQLCRCYDGMAKVAVHLMYPVTDMPILLNHSKKTKSAPKLRKQTAHGLRKVLLKNDPIVSPSELIKRNKKVESNISKNQSSTAVLNTLVHHRTKREVHNYKHFINIDFKDCSTPDMGETRTFRSRHGLVYPVNVARNVARKASETQYNLVSDVELIPSDGLATKFTGMVKRQKINGHYGLLPKWRLAFVIPVFEVEQGEDIPRNKSSLQQLYSEGKAVYFHRWVCSHCQKIPDLQAWIKDDPGNFIKPFAVTKRQFPYHRWEPIYIATKHTPWYSETLSWEGRQDKMTQMLEMCLKSYDFVIMDGAFLIHSPGIKEKPKKKTWRYSHELMNSIQYNMIVKSLAETYPANPKCRLG